MKLLMKIVGAVLALVAVFVCGALAYLFLALPRASAATDLRIERTPEREERGRYLVNHVAGCLVCHSQRDWTQFSGPVAAAAIGSGYNWTRAEGMPGNFSATNLTPTGLAGWTDGEIVRSITEGVGRDGRALFPVMPYQRFREMPTEDVQAMVAYLRSLPPTTSSTPPVAREIDFPLSLLVRTMPQPAAPGAVDPSNKVTYGRYLTSIASCVECHTPHDDSHAPLEGRAFAGGTEFTLANGGSVRAANITPDPVAGIGAWSEDQFIGRFKMYEQATPEALSLKSPRHNTEMPWTAYAGLSRDDLSAIFAYLRTVKPAPEKVQTFETVAQADSRTP